MAVVTKDVLDQLGYAATLVQDATRAFDLIGDKDYDLVVSDIVSRAS